MAAEIKTLSPAHVWSYFYDLTQIPRPTFHTEAVQEYLLALAKRLNLEAQHDATGNILIRKPATPGLEGRPVVTLQAHIDMVPQKNSHIEHDFTKDPIDAYIDGEWVTARDTTLGADNGIGAAYMMAVLSDDTLKHGPLEALFTVDEEVGMVGANGLQPGFSKGDILINLDSEDEGLLFAGCRRWPRRQRQARVQGPGTYARRGYRCAHQPDGATRRSLGYGHHPRSCQR